MWVPDVTPTSISIPSSTGQGNINFETSSGNIENLIAVHPDSLPPAPTSLNLLYGAYAFDITGITHGSSVTLTLTAPNNLPAGTTYWKYQESHTPMWYPIATVLSGNELMITLTDGGTGDAYGVQNGVIHDPGAINIPQTPGIPEFPTVALPMISVIALMFFVQRRKHY